MPRGVPQPRARRGLGAPARAAARIGGAAGAQRPLAAAPGAPLMRGGRRRRRAERGRGGSRAEAPWLVRLRLRRRLKLKLRLRRRRRRRRPEQITTDVLPPGSQRQRKWALQRSPAQAPPRPRPDRALAPPLQRADYRARQGSAPGARRPVQVGPAPPPADETPPLRPRPVHAARAELRPQPCRLRPRGGELEGRAPSRPSASHWMGGAGSRGLCRSPASVSPRKRWGGGSPAKPDTWAERQAHRHTRAGGWGGGGVFTGGVLPGSRSPARVGCV